MRETSVNPIITPRGDTTFLDPMSNAPVAWESAHTFNPAATVYKGRVYLLYRAEDNSGAGGIGSHTSRIGLAESRDGLHFTRRAAPVLYPGNDDQKPNDWTGGCEDPRCVATNDGTFVLTYTEWNHAVARLAVATSRDLLHWTKRGPAFAAADGGRFRDLYCKSGAILTAPKGDQLVAVKINGRYWMYWGEGAVHLATSSDLIAWNPVLDASGNLRDILKTRAGKFDSDLVEGGPPAVLLSQGIVVLYNGKNAGSGGDPNVPGGAYSGGEALFDPKDPTHLEARLDHPFIQPQSAFEVTGQYAAGTVFIEGLARFHGRWRLYFGTADSDVATASASLK